MRIVGCGRSAGAPRRPAKWQNFRKRCVHEQKTWFCVCCTAVCSGGSAWAGESTGAVYSAGQPDYRERKRLLLVCERSGARCRAEDAGRKLFLQTDPGGSQLWPARWPCGRRFVLVLLPSHWRSKPTGKGHRKNENVKGRPGGGA